VTQQIQTEHGDQGPVRPVPEAPAERRAASQREALPEQGEAVAGPQTEPTAGGSRPDPLRRLGAIEVRAAVELGAAELLLRDIAALSPGSVVRLDRGMGDPADLTVNGRLFARGDVVVVDDHLGLRITELAEAADPADDS